MTKTIKQLYDEGQRQFPMRGGDFDYDSNIENSSEYRNLAAAIGGE